MCLGLLCVVCTAVTSSTSLVLTNGCSKRLPAPSARETARAVFNIKREYILASGIYAGIGKMTMQMSLVCTQLLLVSYSCRRSQVIYASACSLGASVHILASASLQVQEQDTLACTCCKTRVVYNNECIHQRETPRYSRLKVLANTCAHHAGQCIAYCVTVSLCSRHSTRLCTSLGTCI